MGTGLVRRLLYPGGMQQPRRRRTESQPSSPTDFAGLVRALPPASPALVQQRALQRRFDAKYIVRPGDLAALLEPVTQHYVAQRAGDRVLAQYETLYFDTPDLRCFYEHQRGRRLRHKVRIRHYPDRQVSFLEVKSKRNSSLTTKHRQAIPFGNSALDADALAFVKSHCKLPTAELQPQLWTNFRRVTLIGLTVPERITIDTQLEFVRGSATETVPGVALIEVKQFPIARHSPIVGRLRSLGYRPLSVSKYCTGTASVRRGLQVNRFLPTLRAIERLRG